MKTPLAWRNLVHAKPRTAVAVAGVGFAVVLILVQIGLFWSVRRTATLTYDQLDFDLVLRSPGYLHLSEAATVPQARLYQAARLSEVASARPFYAGFNLWRNPQNGRRRGILVIGFDPRACVFRLPEIVRQAAALQAADQVLIDRRTRPEFGSQAVGTEAQVGPRRVRIAGQFTLGTGFSADGVILVSDETFCQLFPNRTLQTANLGLVRLRPGADAEAVAQRLRGILPPDTTVLTRADVQTHERRHWVIKTSVGVIFGTGVVLSMIVGLAIVYQVLSSDIADHLGEFATLKAMGYSPGYLTRVVLEQATLLAILGYVPGLAVAAGVYELTARGAHLPITLVPWQAAGVLALAVGMCAAAGMAALRKVHSADPADLF